MKQFLLLICVLSADTFFVDPSLAALDVPKEIPKSGIKLNGVAPTFNAYFAFHIQDPKITKRLATLHEAALNVTADFAPFLVAPDMLQLPLVAFHLDDDDIGRIEYFLDDVVLKRSLREYLPRRVTFFDYGKLYKSYFFSNQMVAMLELIDPWLSNVKDAIRFALNRHGFVCSTAEYYKNYITVIDDTSEKQLNIARINIEDLQMLASAQVCKLYVCRENGDDANRTTFCNVVHIQERVQLLNEAALNVSKDFAPFLVGPTKLVQPLLSIYLEDDDIPRIRKIYDRQLQISLCAHLPRRLPYIEFKAVNNSMMAMSQTYTVLIRALNRQGFIYLGNLDKNMVLITNPLGTKLVVDEIEISQLKLSASAYIDRLYICRGPAPTPDFAAPCNMVIEFPVIQCPFAEISTIAYQHYLMLAHSHS